MSATKLKNSSFVDNVHQKSKIYLSAAKSTYSSFRGNEKKKEKKIHQPQALHNDCIAKRKDT